MFLPLFMNKTTRSKWSKSVVRSGLIRPRSRLPITYSVKISYKASLLHWNHAKMGANPLDRRVGPDGRAVRSVPIKSYRFSDYHSRNRHDCRRRTAHRHHHQTEPEIHDALKRRCFYYWIDYPDAERELAILEVKAPSAPVDLSLQVVAFVQKLRDGLIQATGVAETIDWAHALTQLDCMVLDPDTINNTLERFSNIRTILKNSRERSEPNFDRYKGRNVDGRTA